MPAEPSELRAASESLSEAASVIDDQATAERCREIAERFAGLAESTPDQGTLARLDHVLRELSRATDGEATNRIEAARERLREYRTGVSGV